MRKWSRLAGISGTLIVHLSCLLPFIILPLIPHSITPPKDSAQKEKVLEVILLPIVKVEEKVIPTVDDSNKPVAQTDPRICEHQNNSYVGVGFIYSPFTSLITHIPDFYPAYKAGLRIGDMVLDPDTPIVNGWLDIEIIRGYQQMHFHIKAENICYKNQLTSIEK